MMRVTIRLDCTKAYLNMDQPRLFCWFWPDRSMNNRMLACPSTEVKKHLLAALSHRITPSSLPCFSTYSKSANEAKDVYR